MRFDAIIFDFDGVLLESEFEGNQMLAELLTKIGHPTSIAEAVEHYNGLAGQAFIDAVETRIGQTLPPEFHKGARALRDRSLREGIAAVAGAVEFVRALPRELPKAVALVNPNREDDLSGQGHLCAAGVVFLVLVATARRVARRAS